MIFQKKNGVLWFQLSGFSAYPGVHHGIFTRNQGFSVAPYRSLNVSFKVGDRKKDVERNRYLVSRCLDDTDPVFINQVHGTEVMVLKSNQPPIPEISPVSFEADAVVTDIPDTLLVIQVADCQPVFVFDPVQHVTANIHCGWRGTIRNIIGKTIHAMQFHFACLASDLIAGIGPSLGPCCAEFINFRTEIPDKFWKYKDLSNRFDFWAITRDQLQAAGVRLENIFSSNICTRCRTDLFFSFRGEGETGRFATAIGLKSGRNKRDASRNRPDPLE